MTNPRLLHDIGHIAARATACMDRFPHIPFPDDAVEAVMRANVNMLRVVELAGAVRVPAGLERMPHIPIPDNAVEAVMRANVNMLRVVELAGAVRVPAGLECMPHTGIETQLKAAMISQHETLGGLARLAAAPPSLPPDPLRKRTVP